MPAEGSHAKVNVVADGASPVSGLTMSRPGHGNTAVPAAWASWMKAI